MDEGQKGGGVNVQGVGDEKRGNQTEIWMPHCYERILMSLKFPSQCAGTEYGSLGIV